MEARVAAVEAALQCTHRHPDGVDGATVQAHAVAALSLSDSSGAARVDVAQGQLVLTDIQSLGFRCM